MRADLKKTEHLYKGYQIKGRQVRTSGGWVLCGRHYVEGGIVRNYLIVKDGIQYHAGGLITTLKDAKDIIDNYIHNPSKTA